MQEIRLPLTRCMRLGAWGLILSGCLLALASPAPWPWRFAGAALVLASGGLSWRWYRLRRPVALQAYPDGRLACRLVDGTHVPVRRQQLGVVRPWLVSARLHGVGGRRLDLFVPGRALPGDMHRRLRRALLGFRPRGADDGAAAS